MASSEYLKTKEEASSKDPIKASIYTGVSYLFVVILLILPYFLLANPLISLIFMAVIRFNFCKY